MQTPICSASSAGQLIVVELGADWPSQLLAQLSTVTKGAARRVFSQEESESSTAFAARVAEQLDAVFARGASLGSAVIACCERLDEQARAARAELARAAASRMARGTGGQLLLAAADRNQGRSRAALATLEAELALEWQSAAVETRLCFVGDAPSASPSAPKVDPRSRRAPGSDGTRRVA